MNKIQKFAMLISVLGLIFIFSVILTGVSYPHIFFIVGTCFGLLFIFVGLILFLISWLWELNHIIKRKQYLWAICIVMLGLLVIIKALARIW